MLRSCFRFRAQARLAVGVAALSCAATVLSAVPAAADTSVPRDRMSDTWTATDALGRSLPGLRESGAVRPGKFVGIFYFLWMWKQPNQGLYDISKLLAANPTDPKYGPVHAFHWWGEPHFGYYLNNDAWVIRRHAQMLVDAGIDTLILDVTNALTYPENYLAICRVYTEMRRTGQKTPQLAFILNSRVPVTSQKLYDEFYGKTLYPDLWFRWKGKPLILANPDELPAPLRDFFTVRRSWAWTGSQGWFGDGKDKWPWLDNSPQKPGWHESPDKPEEISVAVAQHPTGNLGRSYQAGKEPPVGERAPEKGLYFDEQWKRALEVSPEFVFVTGWNEWIAQRFVSGKGGGPGFLGRRLNEGETFFVDAYNQEFSRDIEPMRGGHGDNYYYQMVANIRRYKGVRSAPLVSTPKTINLAAKAGFASWDNVSPAYLGSIGDTAKRDHEGWGTAGPYRNTSGRNDFDTMKVARDGKNLYFYVRTAAPITPPAANTNWMTLLLDTDGKAETGWEGFNYAVRLVPDAKGKLTPTLCRHKEGAGWAWTPVLPVTMTRSGNQMHLSIPRRALGLGLEKGPLRLDFKWIDNVPSSGDIRDFLDQGDVAPAGRFRFRYQEKGTEK
ncbi:MAG: hypothetical protein V4671_15225 [Armatimonadota bacterium]